MGSVDHGVRVAMLPARRLQALAATCLPPPACATAYCPNCAPSHHPSIPLAAAYNLDAFRSQLPWAAGALQVQVQRAAS